MDKKGQLAGAPNTVLTFVVLAIVIAVAGIVLSGVRDSVTDTANAATNVTTMVGKGVEGVGKWSTFLPTIAIVLVAALLIAIVVGAFIYFRQ